MAEAEAKKISQIDAYITSNAAQLPIEIQKAKFDEAKAAASEPIAAREAAAVKVALAQAALREWQSSHPPVKTDTGPNGAPRNYYNVEDLPTAQRLGEATNKAFGEYETARDAAKPLAEAQNTAAAELREMVNASNKAGEDFRQAGVDLKEYPADVRLR